CWEIHDGLKGTGPKVEEGAAAVDEGKWVETLGGGIKREAKKVLTGGRDNAGE
ncbi:hypothetical protein KI387_004323, partial [Taxus chinensis]